MSSKTKYYSFFSSFKKGDREMMKRHYPLKFSFLNLGLEEVIVIPFNPESIQELRKEFPDATGILKVELSALVIFVGK